MKRLLNLGLIIGAVLAAPSAASAQQQPWTIYAEDGQFLGYLIADRYHSESICNPYGAYGSEYGNTVFNRYGTYGGEYSPSGTFNPNGKGTPRVLDSRGRTKYRVTVNPNARNGISPAVLRAAACEQ